MDLSKVQSAKNTLEHLVPARDPQNDTDDPFELITCITERAKLAHKALEEFLEEEEKKNKLFSDAEGLADCIVTYVKNFGTYPTLQGDVVKTKVADEIRRYAKVIRLGLCKECSDAKYIQGIALAVSELLRQHGSEREAKDVCASCGLHSISQLRSNGVDESDLETLKEILPDD